ncbi:MAG: tryptophan-rich sensory protein [Chloroflexota bacterium]
MKILRWLNLLTLVGTIAVNSLANILPINNRTTGEISDSYPVLFTPAGYVFAIWSLIYLSLIAFAMYQLLPSQKNNPHIEQIGGWFIAANLFNGGWIFAWHYGMIPLSMILMLGLLVSLLIIYTRLGIGLTAVSQRDRSLLHFPFSLYLGWISVATIANASVLLYTLNWNGFGLSAELWTSFVIIVGGILAFLMIHFRKEITYPLVIVWAFSGILFKPEGSPFVANVAGTTAMLILVFLLYSMLRARQIRLISSRVNRENFR